ncbi:hypothetical protein CCACVL1_10945 [Corchorus capsularis]|uniref:Uncharacterized protein n=1 Tax=Corchorus capsularis TaxID=210143 RepID=A0A1R3INT0_COCAP|nr:hypothetical protein CCACVL1_10945 [Corchorus capsularis]
MVWKKPRVDRDEIGSGHDQTTCDDDIDAYLANPSPPRRVELPNVVDEIIQTQVEGSLGQVSDFTDINPNEETIGEIVDWDQLQVIEAVDHKFRSDEFGSLVCQAFIDKPIIPTGFDDMESYGFQSLCASTIFPIS